MNKSDKQTKNIRPTPADADSVPLVSHYFVLTKLATSS